MIQIDEQSKSQVEFEAIVDKALRNSVRLSQVDEAYLVRVRGWFDYKWEGFSGTVMHEIAIWRGDLRIPPFHPSRILSEKHFRVDANGLREVNPRQPLHMVQASADNLRRRASDISKSGLFVWYSASGEESDKASLMIYSVVSGESSGWYAGFFRQGDWRLGQVKGIPKRAIVESILC
jgi:hypothetical protein